MHGQLQSSFALCTISLTVLGEVKISLYYLRIVKNDLECPRLVEI